MWLTLYSATRELSLDALTSAGSDGNNPLVNGRRVDSFDELTVKCGLEHPGTAFSARGLANLTNT